MRLSHRTRKLQQQTGATDACIEAFHAAAKYLRRKQSTGVAIGAPMVAGRCQEGELAVCVHVPEKLPVAQLTKAQVLPKTIAGVRLDVIESAFRPRALPAAERLLRQWLPAAVLRPGVEVSTDSHWSAGTIGMLVRDLSDGALCLLSAAHVLAAAPASRCLQPGLRNSGSVIGRVRRSLYGPEGDAAIAVLESSRPASAVPLGLTAAPTGVGEIRVGMQLIKSGAVSGVTRARVRQTGWYKVDDPSRGVDQVIWCSLLLPLDDADPDEISEPGDSGSVWLDAATGMAVAMTIAGDAPGTRDTEWTLACHLDLVFDRLGLSLDNLP